MLLLLLLLLLHCSKEKLQFCKLHHKTLLLQSYCMNSTTTQFVPSRRMGLYELVHQMSLDLPPPLPLMLEVNANSNNQVRSSEDTSHRNDQEASNPDDKVLIKKAYVQQLESSKLRLIQLEQELHRARQQGLAYAGNTNPGITAFEVEYGHWVEEQNRQVSDLKNALHSEMGDTELQIFVERGMRHYFELFAMKATAARADVLYIMSGMWKTSAERFFLWIGGFRASELLKVLSPHLDDLTEQQRLDIVNLRQSCQQAEESLSQGMERLQFILAQAIADGLLRKGNYLQIEAATNKLEDLIRFVLQADHLRHETLQQISRILTTRQAASGLLALGEYLQHLRVLSSCWSSRPRDVCVSKI